MFFKSGLKKPIILLACLTLFVLQLYVDVHSPKGHAAGTLYVMAVATSAVLGPGYPVALSVVGSGLVGVGHFLSPDMGDIPSAVVFWNRFSSMIEIWFVAVMAVIMYRIKESPLLQEVRKYSMSDVGTYDWDWVTGEQNWDPVMHDLFFMERGTFDGTFDAFFSRVHPDDMEKVQRNIEIINADPTVPFEYTYRVVHPETGKIEWRKARTNPIVIDGKLERIIGSVWDVTKEETTLRNQNIALDAAVVGVWVWNIQTGDNKWDERMHNLYRIPQGTFNRSYDAYTEFLLPGEKERVGGLIDKALSGEGEFTTDFHIKRGDGTEAVIHAESVIVHDREGNPAYMIGVNWDRTDAWNHEHALKAERDRFSDLIENLHGAFWVWDNRIEGRSFVSKQYEEIFGRPIDPVFEKETENDWQDPVDAELDLQGRDTPLDYEFQIDVDGKRKWIWTRGFPVFEEGSEKPLRFVGVTEDITDRKAIEVSLRESQERLRAYLEHSPVCTKIIDSDFNLQYMSAAGINGLGLNNVEDFYGNPYPFDFYPENFRTEMRGNMREALKSRQIIEQEAPVVNTSGKEVWFHSTIVPVFPEDGSEEYLLVVSMDTTERNIAERQLRRSNADLERFAYIASHDLQEPLRMVSSFLGLIEKRYEDKLDDKGREYINFAVDGAKRMSRLINDLLLYSRALRLEAEAETFSLDEIAREASEPFLGESDFVFFDLPVVTTGRTFVRQIIQNLVSNAVKYGANMVEITSENQGYSTVVCISDDGCGIAQEYHATIFEPFKRLEHTKKGTGVGLSICKAYADRLGGDVWVESEPGKGSKFYFSFKNEKDSTSRG